ncbi:paeninodin family lasso peptide [Evansella sp. LMS18]|nr:paeninodin family lasso peptide [Evansella sp. LMS18]UTR10556.1 paeninodin family lasso peptide [Evansella sp. LMS18]
MKKEWEKPNLEVLDVGMTMANTKPGDFIDDSFPAGTRFSDLTWGEDS